VSAATNSMGKCYADTVAIGNGAKKPDLIYMNTAWTTVASNSSNIAIIALSPQPNNVTINVISSPVENIRPDFIQMLLTFPLDPPHITIEILQDSIYANSPILDDQRFADEFVKRRKADDS
ncbi:4704_t:CDS:2, partial [Funneliformis geosporum]